MSTMPMLANSTGITGVHYHPFPYNQILHNTQSLFQTIFPKAVFALPLSVNISTIILVWK